MKRALVWFVVLIAVAVPSVTLAQSAVTANDSVLVAVDRDVVVAAGDSIGTLVVVSGDVTVLGRVKTVVIVAGTLTVSGTVDETVVAVESDVTLGATAVVGGDVVIASGALTRDEGSTIGGSVTRNFDLRFGWVLTLVSILFWVGITIGLMIAGVVLVAVARRQIQGAGDLMSGAPRRTILTTVIMVIALPVLAVAAFLSVIGVPVALALLLVVLPLLYVTGYLTVSERLGRWVLRSGREGGDGAARPSPYLAVLLGVAIFQIGGLVPVVGGLVVWLAATYGAGGLVFYAWRAWRSNDEPTPAPAPLA